MSIAGRVREPQVEQAVVVGRAGLGREQLHRAVVDDELEHLLERAAPGRAGQADLEAEPAAFGVEPGQVGQAELQRIFEDNFLPAQAAAPPAPTPTPPSTPPSPAPTTQTPP